MIMENSNDEHSAAPLCYAELPDGWIIHRRPTLEDAADGQNCVEVTYSDGRMGWEAISAMRSWCKAYRGGIRAWRKIRPAYTES